MPASHASSSRPDCPSGATPTAHVARTTRSGRSAAQASACGPPPEPPETPKRSKSRWSASRRTSSTSSATRRPGRRVDRPYPARSCVTKQTPRPRYSSSSGQRLSRHPGVPCSPRTRNPSGSPQTANASTRPSGVVTVLSESPTNERSLRDADPGGKQDSTLRRPRGFGRRSYNRPRGPRPRLPRHRRLDADGAAGAERAARPAWGRAAAVRLRRGDAAAAPALATSGSSSCARSSSRTTTPTTTSACRGC